MSTRPLFSRPEFVPEFSDYEVFRRSTFGVTGHRGILGGILHRRLVQANVHVDAYEGDVNDDISLVQWFEARRFSHFLHFAAIVPVARVEGDPLLAYQTNAIGSFNVCKNILVMQKECWLFHASTSHVYTPRVDNISITEDAATEPKTFYGVTKLAAERVIQPLLTRLQAPFCIGRIFSFSHESQHEPYLVPSLRSKIEKLGDGSRLDVNNPSSVRDIQDAETVVDCILHLAYRRTLGTLNIGTGNGQSVRGIAMEVARVANRNIVVHGTDKDLPSALIADTRRLRSALSA